MIWRGSLARLGRWWRRWFRLAIPIGLALAVLTVTVIAHAVQSVDVGDADYLNPASHAGIGGADLAGRLTAAGVSVQRVTSSDQVLAAGFAGNVTIFIPAPSLMLPSALDDLRKMAPTTHLIVVAPDDSTLSAMGYPAVGVRTRWATAVADPGCTFTPAHAAGAAGIDGSEYSGHTATSCYLGGLVEMTPAQPQLLLAGASDPFRNDRIGEAGNAALVTALLDTTSRVVWLDLHRIETPPPPVNGAGASAPPGTDEPTGGTTGGAGGPGGGGGGGGGGTGQPPGGGSGAPQPSIADLFPSWLWALVGLIVLVGVALAVGRARRLGPPVPEPLPVAARGRESVEGRGRLYRRARQPDAALAVLRRAAFEQMPALLGLPPRTPGRDLIVAAAAHTGWPEDMVSGILLDDTPRKHAELLTATHRLDELMHALHRSPYTPEGADR